jgi:C4-dicarboxylate-specific signal transduction histidine kinase
MQQWITQFNSNKLQRTRLESTQFHTSNSSGEEDCLCISVPAEVEKKKKLENSKPVAVEEKDNLHNSIPAPAEKMTTLHNVIPAAMERKIICIILFQQWQRRRQKFIIQFQQQQRKRSVVWEMDHYVANVAMKT